MHTTELIGYSYRITRNILVETSLTLTRLQTTIALILAGAAAAFLGQPHAWRLAIALPLFAAAAVIAVGHRRRA